MRSRGVRRRSHRHCRNGYGRPSRPCAGRRHCDQQGSDPESGGNSSTHGSECNTDTRYRSSRCHLRFQANWVRMSPQQRGRDPSRSSSSREREDMKQKLRARRTTLAFMAIAVAAAFATLTAASSSHATVASHAVSPAIRGVGGAPDISRTTAPQARCSSNIQLSRQAHRRLPGHRVLLARPNPAGVRLLRAAVVGHQRDRQDDRDRRRLFQPVRRRGSRDPEQHVRPPDGELLDASGAERGPAVRSEQREHGRLGRGDHARRLVGPRHGSGREHRARRGREQQRRATSSRRRSTSSTITSATSFRRASARPSSAWIRP